MSQTLWKPAMILAKFAQAFVFLLVLSNENNYASWEIVYQSDDIVVEHQKSTKTEISIFRARAVIPGSVAEIMAVIFDLNTQKDWNNTGYGQKIVKKVSQTEMIFYSAMKAPWPLLDRDFVVHLQALRSQDGKSIEISAKETEFASAPELASKVRMPVSRIHWVLTPLGPGKTYVSMSFQIDPGGIIPVFVMNIVRKRMPLRGLRNIRELVQEKKYNPLYFTEFKRKYPWN